MPTYLYRYWKAWGQNYNTGEPEGRAYLTKCLVLSQTDKTYKIVGDDGRTRNVLKGDGKRYAHETKEQAWYSLQRRLAHERVFLERRLRLVMAIQMASITDVSDEQEEFSV